MTLASDTCELSDFRQNAPVHLDQLAETGRVEILTVDGEAKGVVMAPHVFDRMADQIEQAEITAALRRGFADIAAGRVRPAEEFYRELVAEFGLDLTLVEDPSVDGK